ncbi:MAG: tyrosine-type recombinase/integrase [Solirubrobacteraceae bacterium]
MSTIAPILQSFFAERLLAQRHASPHTVLSYRDTLRLLLTFAHHHTGKEPYRLELEDLDASLITAFLDHLEQQRGNTPRTRNTRLAAIRSLYRFAILRHPEHAELIARVLAIPSKRTQRPVVCYLNRGEIDALLRAPDRDLWLGRRDHAMLLVMITTGLRVSELTGLSCTDLQLGQGACLHCHGKGRKDRISPLTKQTAAVLRVWLRERAGRPEDPLFPTRRGKRLSRDAVEDLLAKHIATAAAGCPSLTRKNVTPHVLRHTTAMQLLDAGNDITVIALWLGHESIQSTQTYLHASLKLKEQALARTAPPHTTPGRFKPSDQLLAYLESLDDYAG